MKKMLYAFVAALLLTTLGQTNAQKLETQKPTIIYKKRALKHMRKACMYAIPTVALFCITQGHVVQNLLHDGSNEWEFVWEYNPTGAALCTASFAWMCSHLVAALYNGTRSFGKQQK